MPCASDFYWFVSKRSGVPVQQPITEQQGFVDKALQKLLARSCQASLKAIKNDLETADKQITELIQSDSRLKELFEWITSVPGVGLAIATEVLVATDEFKSIMEPKKLACHASVAPFEYKSGSSVRGKTRVSQHARLRLKSLFHLGAMSVIQMKGELQDYYQRKLGEGKNKMLVLNAVRNNRTDFYDSNNNGGIKIFIFFSALYASKNTMDQFVTDVIND